MDKKYTIVVGKQRIEVSEDVYRAYYQEREHEKYLEKRALGREYSLENSVEENSRFESAYGLMSPSPEEKLLKAMEMQALREAVMELGEEERDLIIKIYYQGKDLRTVAAEYGISHTAVIKRRDKILKKLRNLKISGYQKP